MLGISESLWISECVNHVKLLLVCFESPFSSNIFLVRKKYLKIFSCSSAWDFCLQHHTYGTCNGGTDHSAHLTRFFYNRKTKQCEPYFYTGCGARGNHFETKSQCNQICTRRLRRSGMCNNSPSQDFTEYANRANARWQSVV